MSKFDDLYKLIQEGRFGGYGRSRRDQLAFGYDVKTVDGNVLFGTYPDGTPVVDPVNGMQIIWKVLASEFNTGSMINYITGEKIAPSMSTFWLPNFRGTKNGIHIPVEYYNLAYATNDAEAIAKMESLGLSPDIAPDYR
jgi:hypothetical protein